MLRKQKTASRKCIKYPASLYTPICTCWVQLHTKTMLEHSPCTPEWFLRLQFMVHATLMTCKAYGQFGVLSFRGHAQIHRFESKHVCFLFMRHNLLIYYLQWGKILCLCALKLIQERFFTKTISFLLKSYDIKYCNCHFNLQGLRFNTFSAWNVRLNNDPGSKKIGSLHSVQIFNIFKLELKVSLKSLNLIW